MMRKMTRRLFQPFQKFPLLLLLLGLWSVTVSCANHSPSSHINSTSQGNSHFQNGARSQNGNFQGNSSAQNDTHAEMLLGNPDGATPSASNVQHYLIQRSQYALSYNNTLRFPNWVAWHLSASDVGDTARGQFVPDQTLPAGFTEVTPSDYTHSGYDRGHNCPSADRSDTPKNNDAVFLMTNMTPQAHGLNAGPWERLESYCRDLAAQGNELYITCGHGFSAPTHGIIGKDQIAVPDFAWKVVVIIPDRSGNDLARITPQTRVIAVRMPNVSTISRQDWTRYEVTAAAIEQETGLHFFTNLAPAVAAALRIKRDAANPLVATLLGPSASGQRVHRSRSSHFAAPILSAASPATSAVYVAPLASSSPAAAPDATGDSASVWVNTRSGAYWMPGTRFYGKTKEGKYMSEADALRAGYHPEGKR